VRVRRRSVLIASALLVALVHPPPAMIEHLYANGFYPAWDLFERPLVERVPFAVGDVPAALLALHLVRTLLGARERGLSETLGGLLATVAAVALWFFIGWGLNYQRPGFERRLVVRADHVTARSIDALANRTIREMNAVASAAHREMFAGDDARLGARLTPTFDAAIERLGTTDVFAPPRVKPTIFDRFMISGGTSGFMNPWTHEVSLVSTLSPAERPAYYAHEWSHVAGFADEAEANYLATLACIRSSNPLLRYSGWLLVWFNLPRDVHATAYATPLVRADVTGIVRRVRGEMQPAVANAQRTAYGAYLRANGVRAGYADYRGFIRWLVAAEADRDGLPIVRRTR